MNNNSHTTKDKQTPALLIAEGDSWFDYPFLCTNKHIVKQLKKFPKYKVESIAKYSHSLNLIFSEQRDQFKNKIKKISGSEKIPKAILLSAGGNDFVARLPALLNEAGQDTPILNENEVQRFLSQLYNDYHSWLNFITITCNKTFKTKTPLPILIHGYAHPVPDGRKFKCSSTTVFFKKSWLKKVFDKEGHHNLTTNTKTMEFLVR